MHADPIDIIIGVSVKRTNRLSESTIEVMINNNGIFRR